MNTKNSEQFVVDHLGRKCYEAEMKPGYYHRLNHFYFVHDNGITHVNIDIINRLERVFLAESEILSPISKEIFEQELCNAIFNIGIYEFVQPK